MGWYRSWFGTRYYALLYGHRNERDARVWVDSILGRWGLPQGSRVLDMACGRGRHAGWFHERGMVVSGIDISADSVAEARAQHAGVDFHVHDMREPFGHEQFDAITCLFTSLGYFDSVDDDRKVLKAAYDALVPGGRFVVDFMNTPRVLKHLVASERTVREGVRFDIERMMDGNTIVKRIHIEDQGHAEDFEERVQALLPAEIEALAIEAGFELIECTDGPVPDPYSPDRSERCVFWMKKPVG